MANKTQDKLYETFRAVLGAGERASRPDPPVDVPERRASSTVNMGTVAAKPEPAGQPAPGAASDAAPETSLARLVSMVVPPAEAASTAPANRASSEALPSVNDAGTNVRPSATTTASTSESTTSTLLQSVFGSVPLVGTVAGAATGSSGGSTFDTIASTVLKSGLGLIPLIGSLVGLFGGGDSSTPALQKYTMPGTIGYEGADTRSGISALNFDQLGMPRTSGDTSGGSSSGGNSSGNTATPQITVNVQAMDARSFMDRSSDIAAAVRDAMLNMNSINDVVNELS